MSSVSVAQFMYEIIRIRNGRKRFVLSDGLHESSLFEFAVAAEFVEGVEIMLKVGLRASEDDCNFTTGSNPF